LAGRGGRVSNTTTWALPDHSAAKHEMLRRYLAAWFAKLASTGARRPRSQLNFIDAFAGPGVYEGGEPGSPIVALTTLVEHRGFDNWSNVKFLFYFVEANVDRYQSLEEQVALLWARRQGGRPSNVSVQIVNKSFFDTVADLTKISESRGGTSFPVPTFAFVDPFGFSDLPIAKLCGLLHTGSCEVLFNFMYNDINRFFTFENEKHRSKLMMLFDYDEFPSVDGLNAHQREDLLNQHIEQVFRQRGSFEYVRSFQMEGMTNRTLYSLFFATHRIEGLEVMKDVMWKIDPVEGRRFSDRLADQPSLFEGQPNYRELTRLVLLRLASSKMTINEMENFVTIDTDFKSTHLRAHVLKPLEREGTIIVTSQNVDRRKGTFAAGCIIALAE
jgi:three-Cys-motif partner protein